MSKVVCVQKSQLLNFHLKPYYLYLPYLPRISVYVGVGRPTAKFGHMNLCLQMNREGLAKTGSCVYSREPVTSTSGLATSEGQNNKLRPLHGFASVQFGGFVRQFRRHYVLLICPFKDIALLRLCSLEVVCSYPFRGRGHEFAKVI